MSGYSVDEQTIADFLRKLGTSSFFAGVDLEETSQVTQEGVKQKKFTLRAQVDYAGVTPVAPPAGPKPGTPPAKTAAAEPSEPTMTAARGKVVP